MPTSKKRLNVTLSPEMEGVIKKLAKRDKVPQARKITELLLIALEVEEDSAWDELAEKRDTSNAQFVSHKKAWI